MLWSALQNKWEEVQWERVKDTEKSREARERARDRARLAREQYRLYGDSGDVPRSILKNADSSYSYAALGTRTSTATSTTSALDPMPRPITANVKGRLLGHLLDTC